MCLAAGQQRSRCAAAAHAQPVRLRECRKRVHTGRGRYGRKAGRSVAVVRVSLEGSVSGRVHVYMRLSCTRTAQAHLDRYASSGRGEVGGGGNGGSSDPTTSDRRAAAAAGDGGDD